ncbi:DJ-1/PfpI family protein, partial [Ruminococcus sp.]|uniref:DJ-1/PfpI family protein n=1 Tax=Ruminococcus sp. TaxID=41978 RepID=UPI00344B0688
MAIPGGFEEYGFYDEAFSAEVGKLIKDFETCNKAIASVCVGALVLAHSGILRGKRATTYHLNDGVRQKQLAAYDVEVVNEPVVVDDNIITS